MFTCESSRSPVDSSTADICWYPASAVSTLLLVCLLTLQSSLGIASIKWRRAKVYCKMLLLTNFPHTASARNIVSRRLPLLSRLVKLLKFSKNMLSQELPFSLDHFHQRRRGIINSNRILTVCLCIHLKEAISHSDVSETLSLQPVKQKICYLSAKHTCKSWCCSFVH